VKRKWLTTKGKQYDWDTMSANIDLEMSQYCWWAANHLGIISNLKASVIMMNIWLIMCAFIKLAINIERKKIGEGATRMDYKLCTYATQNEWGIAMVSYLD